MTYWVLIVVLFSPGTAWVHREGVYPTHRECEAEGERLPWDYVCIPEHWA